MVGTIPTDMTGVTCHILPMSYNLRATIEGHTEGCIKIWLKDKILLAAQVIGHMASETIQELANTMAQHTSIEDVATIIHAHPTYGEINRTIFEYALGKAIEVDEAF
jgi:dihydrolipoamide dehydrogenase